MGELKLTTFPVDSSHQLDTQCAVYIQQVGRSNINFLAHDILHEGLPPKTVSLEEAQAYVENKLPTLQVKRRSILGRSFTAYEMSGTEPLAQMDCATWSFGHWIISFPGNSPSHDLDMRPAGGHSRSDLFVVDSIPFFWEPQGDGAVRKLWKAANGKRIEVGELRAKNSRETQGLLKIDTNHVDRLVGIMTGIAVLKRLESFRW